MRTVYIEKMILKGVEYSDDADDLGDEDAAGYEGTTANDQADELRRTGEGLAPLAAMLVPLAEVLKKAEVLPSSTPVADEGTKAEGGEVTVADIMDVLQDRFRDAVGEITKTGNEKTKEEERCRLGKAYTGSGTLPRPTPPTGRDRAKRS